MGGSRRPSRPRLLDAPPQDGDKDWPNRESWVIRTLTAAAAALLFARTAAAAILSVGPGQHYAAPNQAVAAAHDGDTVAIAPGTYRDCAIVRQNDLTIEGAGPGVVLADTPCAGKALLVIDGANVTVKNLTLRHARVPDGNGAGIRAEGGNLTVTGVRFIDDEDGILTAPNPKATVRVLDSSFTGDGSCRATKCTHGIDASQLAKLEVERSRFFDIKGGHAIRSRAALTVVKDCTIEDGANGTSSYQIDLPNGGNLLVEGSTLEKGPKSSQRGTAITIGDDGVSLPTRRIVVRNNTLINHTGGSTVFVRDISATPAILLGNKFEGDSVTPTAGGWASALALDAILKAKRFAHSLIDHARVGVILLVGLAGLLLGFAGLAVLAVALRRTAQRRRMSGAKVTAIATGLLLLLGSASVAAVAMGLQAVGRPPQDWANFVAMRAAGHNPAIVGVADRVAGWLRVADRLRYAGPHALPDWIGASPARDTAPPSPDAGPVQQVNSVGALGAALNVAVPGETIVLKPGTYRLEGRGFYLGRAGRPNAPITLRAARLGDAVIESNVVEAIKVAAPYWHFENLVIRGVCENDSDCEHAFHVVGQAHDTVIRNSLLENFNAQVKINMEQGLNPDHGLIADDTLIDTHPRDTPNPITPVDLDTASGWRITGTLIADFIKAQGNGVSYGAFAKAAGTHNLFDHNVVLCQYALHGYGGERVGLSFGGGGSPDSIRRDQGRSGNESYKGTMRDNLIAFCSDDGIYINRAAHSVISHNTLLATGGIDVRFPQSSAQVDNNIVDGSIRSRVHGLLFTHDNLATWLPALFLGWHPERSLYENVATLDLRWRHAPAGRGDAAKGTDLCGVPWPREPRPGAFQDFAACLARAHGTPSVAVDQVPRQALR